MKKLFLLVSGVLALLATTAAPASAERPTAWARAGFCVADEPVQQPERAHRAARTAKGWNRDAPARINVGDSNYDSGLAPNVPAGFKATSRPTST